MATLSIRNLEMRSPSIPESKLSFTFRYFDRKQALTRLCDAARLKNLRKKPDLTFVPIHHTGIRSKKFGKKIHLVRNIKNICCEKLR
ncbi:hypothetical protein KBT16_19130 [Nostoc sp. CCCryo 231-06]|nr:hypothetical protein [Nostoc sp. CCCryo 231-06]